MLKSNFETTKQRIDGDLPKNNVDLAHAYDWFFKVVVGQDISAHEVGINWKMQKKNDNIKFRLTTKRKHYDTKKI